MKTSFTLWASALLAGVHAACPTPMLLDNYANISTTGTNARGGHSGDDSTCTSISGSNTVLTIVPGSSRCYFYVNTQSEDAIGGGRSALQFNVTSPADAGSFKINAKTWNNTNLVDSYVTLTGLAKGTTLMQIPLTSFNGPDPPSLRNIMSLVFESFTTPTLAWQIGELTLLCGATTTATSTA